MRVRGEISGLKFNSSGHVYFDLKDDKAVLNAVIWRTTAQRLKVKPEQGLEVVCTGTGVHLSRLLALPAHRRPAWSSPGLGALMAMLEARKKKLAAEGLFDAARKKPHPVPAAQSSASSPRRRAR